MPASNRWKMASRLSALQPAQEGLESNLRGEEFSDDLIHDLALVTEEVLVNIVKHGFAGQEVEDAIQLALDVDHQRQVSLTFVDSAPAFDPLSVEERDPDDDRPGGWGIPMLKSLSDRVHYQYVDGRNQLTIHRSEREP